MQRTTPHPNQHHLHLLSLLSLLCTALLALSACSTVNIREQESDQPVTQIIPSKLAIVHTGGIEGAYVRNSSSMGIAAVAELADQLEEEGYEVLLFDSGNSLAGSALVDLSDGETAVGFMNAAGYDAMTLGSLELELGKQTLTKRISQSDFAQLSANVVDATSREPLTNGRRTYTLGDGRIVGVFGLTSPQATAGIGPLSERDLALSYDDLTTTAQRQVSELKAQGCRLIVCLACLGFDGQGLPLADTVAAKVDGIDLLLDASTGDSSHVTRTNESGGQTLVVETAGRLRGASVVTWASGSLSTQTYDSKTAKKNDEQVLSLVTQAAAEMDRQLKKVVSTSRDALTPDRSLSASCGLGQLAADALLWEATHSTDKAPGAAILTASALQEQLPKGNVSYADALKVLPHASTRLCMLEVSGSRLQELLQPLLAATPTASGNMPQVSGIAFAETPVAEGNPPAPRSITSVGGRPFAATDTYTIVTCENLLSSGGALAELADGATLSEVGSSGGKALAGYLEQECKDGIPDRYFQ